MQRANDKWFSPKRKEAKCKQGVSANILSDVVRGEDEKAGDEDSGVFTVD